MPGTGQGRELTSSARAPGGPRTAPLHVRVRRALATRGLRAMPRMARRYLWLRARPRVMRVRGTWFDVRHGVDTRGVLYLPGAAGGGAAPAHHYQGIAGGPMRRSLAALGVDPARFMFVDLGCGKGKALIAAAHRGFGRVVGVEISPVLADAARDNLERWRGRARSAVAAEVLTMDARAFEFPPEPTVLFLFNPFPRDVLQTVLDGLGRSLAQRPREVRVIYVNPVHRDLLDAAPYLARRAEGHYYAVYEGRRRPSEGSDRMTTDPTLTRPPGEQGRAPLRRRIGRALATHGLRGTAGVAALFLRLRARDWTKQARDTWFDLRHGVDTRGVLYHGRSDDFAVQQAVHYETVENAPMRDGLASLGVDPSGFTFVDLGCGKGKVLVVAAARGFRRLIGVELSPVLADAARTNLARRRDARRTPVPATVLTQDARTFEFPPEPTVLFLFHPFFDGVMRTVLDNLRRSLAEHPREVRILYVNPYLSEMLDGEPFLARRAQGPDFVVYEASAA